MIFSLNLHENHNVPAGVHAENTVYFHAKYKSLIEMKVSKYSQKKIEVGFQCLSFLGTERNKFIKFCEVNFKTFCDLHADLRKGENQTSQDSNDSIPAYV